jgi:hypothetical protein
METFELIVGQGSYELHCPEGSKELTFPTLLAAFAYAQVSMAEEQAQMVVHAGDGSTESLPLYRMTA